MATVIPTTAPQSRPARRRPHGANQAGKQMHGSKLTYVILAVVVLISIFPFYWTILAASTSNTEINKVPPNWLPGGNLFKNFQRRPEQRGHGQGAAELAHRLRLRGRRHRAVRHAGRVRLRQAALPVPQPAAGPDHRHHDGALPAGHRAAVPADDQAGLERPPGSGDLPDAGQRVRRVLHAAVPGQRAARRAGRGRPGGRRRPPCASSSRWCCRSPGRRWRCWGC